MPILDKETIEIPNPWFNQISSTPLVKKPKPESTLGWNWKRGLSFLEPKEAEAESLALKPSIGRTEHREIQNPWFTPQGSEDTSPLTTPQREIQNPWLEGYQPEEEVPIVSSDRRLDLPMGMIRATPPTTLQTVGNLVKTWGPDLGKIYMSGAIAASVAAKLPVPWQGKAAVLAIGTGLLYETNEQVWKGIQSIASGESTDPEENQALISKLIGAKPSPLTDPLMSVLEQGAIWGSLGPLFKGVKIGLLGGEIKGTLGKKGVKEAIGEFGQVVGRKTIPGITRAITWPLDKTSEIWQPYAQKILDNYIVKPLRIQIPGAARLYGKKGSRSIQELFQPAVERLERFLPKTAQTFRKTGVMKALASKAGSDLVDTLKKELPSVQVDVIKALSNVPKEQIKNPRALEIIDEFKGRIYKTTNQRYADTFLEALSIGISKPLTTVEAKVSSPSVSRYMRVMEQALVGKPTLKPQEISKVLYDMIRDPRVGEPMTQFARDMVSFPYQLPLDIANASRQASKEYLLYKLLRTPGIISATRKLGYLESTQPGIKGLYIHRDVELELEAWNMIPKFSNSIMNKWFTSPWKTNKIILRPATHFRNLYSNMILNDWGGLPFYKTNVYTKALTEMVRKGPLWREFDNLTASSGLFGKQELYQLESGLKYGASLPDKFYNIYDGVVAPARSLYSAEESYFKFAKYLHNRTEKGLGRSEAALDAIKWTFNYGEVTPLTAELRSAWWGAPFITWQTKVLPLMVETAVKHPLRFGKWIAIGSCLHAKGIEAVGLSPDEWDKIHEDLPEYIKKGIYLMLPWRDSQDRLNLLNLTYMVPGIGDLAELFQRGAFKSMGLQNPVFTTLATFTQKEPKKYSGAPIYYDWESPKAKATKIGLYLWEQWAPASVPGGVDFQTLYNAIQERPEAVSPEQALAGWVGLRVTPVSPGETKRRRDALEKIHRSELTMYIARKLKKAKNAEEREAILLEQREIEQSGRL